ncbi:hypothetical protein GlitD10_1710 [Gloeomargarita lithophora Alchichica-D10]|uniref:Uncharacterized protein n=2 Tax=Gloeomargarita TaxID=1188227 RepID=A0A1J0ADP9_9CYAN|nr:hypothetical protein GlitD10_1710 [Gloeomargarita lithophora Alchichica-D10]
MVGHQGLWKLPSLLGLLLMVSGVGVAQAQPNPFLASVRQQLREAGRAAEQEGYRLSHDPFTGKLRPKEAEFITITLKANVSYLLVAVCDQDCRDMDLRLFDENRNLISEDMSPDAVPVVSVTPKRTATFRVQAIMSRCAARDCLYGVGAFAR